MRLVLGFVSTLAVGFFAAAVLAVVASDLLPVGRAASGLAQVDYGSLALGLVLGVLISSIARFRWVEIPRRIVAYMVGLRGTFRLMGWAVVFVAVLYLY